MELLMQSPMSESQNLTNFLSSALPGKQRRSCKGHLLPQHKLPDLLHAFPSLHIGKWPCFHQSEVPNITSCYHSLWSVRISCLYSSSKLLFICQIGCCLSHESLNKKPTTVNCGGNLFPLETSKTSSASNIEAS